MVGLILVGVGFGVIAGYGLLVARKARNGGAPDSEVRSRIYMALGLFVPGIWFVVMGLRNA